MRRVRRVVVVLVALAIGLIAVGPALVKPVGKRLAIAERPSDYGLVAEDLTFAPDDRPIALAGWWIGGSAPRAALVFVHGGGDDNRSLPYGGGLALARDLVAKGYALLMIDLRNFGESDGTPEGITYGELESHDVVGAVAAIAAKAPGVPIGAIGFSMGGATVLRAAAREPRIRAVVADSALADARDVSVAFVHAATGLPSLLAAAFVWSAEHLHGAALGRGNTVAALTGARMPPVLLVHDVHDPIVPPAQIHRLAHVLPAAEVWQTSAAAASPFGTHIQSYKLGPEAYVARVTTFLDAALAATAR